MTAPWPRRSSLLFASLALSLAASVAASPSPEKDSHQTKSRKNGCDGDGGMPPLPTTGSLDENDAYLSKLRSLASLQADPRDAVCVWIRARRDVVGAIEKLIQETPEADAASAVPERTSPDGNDRAAGNGEGDLRENIAGLRSLLGQILVFKSDVDPQNLRLDFFAAQAFSNLYRDPKMQGYLDESNSFVVLEIRQQLSRHRKSGFGTFGTLSFQSKKQSAPEPSAAESTGPGATVAAGGSAGPDVISSVSGFGFEGGFATWRSLFGSHLDGVLFVGLGVAGIASDSIEDPEGTDRFKRTYHAGLRLKQRGGAWQGTYSEFSYLRDPRFSHPDRFQVLGRIVLSPELEGSKRGGLGAYVEGAVSLGRGRDEVRLTAGVRIDPLGVLRGLVGSVGAGSPGGSAADSAN